MNFVCEWVDDNNFKCSKQKVIDPTLPVQASLVVNTKAFKPVVETFAQCPQGGCSRCGLNDDECKKNKLPTCGTQPSGNNYLLLSDD